MTVKLLEYKENNPKGMEMLKRGIAGECQRIKSRS